MNPTLISDRARSRALGQEEHNVMLALGLVRAAGRAVLLLEPGLARACELVIMASTPRAAANRRELNRLVDQLASAIHAADFEGYRLLDGTTAVFSVEAASRAGEPLSVILPDLTSVILGDAGLADFASRAADRATAERMAEAIRKSLQVSRQGLLEAERQLSVLLAHFHKQRSQYAHLIAPDHNLAEVAVVLRQHVLHAGPAALAAQGELSSRTFSLVLRDP